MTGEARRKDIREIHRTYKSFYVVTSIAVALGVGIFIGAAVFAEEAIGYAMNLVTEGFGVAVSVVITVFVIDRIYDQRTEERQTEELKRRLVREAGSRVNSVAVAATEQLRVRGWLRGGAGILKGSFLPSANLQGADLQGADLQDTVLVEANLQEADMLQANLQNAQISLANLRNARLCNGILREADLQMADLQGANLMGADLRGADLTNANLQNADLHRANLKGAKLHNVNLQGADLGKVDLEYANLFGTNLQDTNLDRANLENAKLRNVNLKTANLSGASLKGVMVTLSEAPVAWFLREPRGEPGEPRGIELLHPTELSGATLPDGTPFPADPSLHDELERFTNPEHPDFPKTLEKIKDIHRDWEEIE